MATLVALLASVALASTTQAQTPTPGPGARSVTPPTLHGELALTLQEALAMSIENNLDVEIERFTPLTAEEQRIGAWGAYDPSASADLSHRAAQFPIASELQPSFSQDERETSGSAGVFGLVPKLGWTYEIGYQGSALESTSAIQSLSPEYRTGVIGSVRMPILKGFLWGEPWVQVKSSEILADAADEQFRTSLMDTVQQVENSYWALIATEEQLRVQNKSLEASVALLDQTSAQYEVGVVSRVEVTEAEAGVAEREVEQIVAENRYRQAQDLLIDVVLGPHLTPTSGLEIRPMTRPDPVDYQVDADEAARKAFSNRPELAIAQAEVDRLEIFVRFAKNQRLPQLDLVGTNGFQGLSGKTNPADGIFGPRAPIPAPRDYSQSHDDFFSKSGNENYTVGAVLSFPIGMIRERADVRRANLDLRRSVTQMRRLEQSIVFEIRDTIRNLETALEALNAAEKRRLANEEQLRAENIRLEHGESTPFDVLLRERDLVSAESQVILAQQTYRESISALDRAQGTILRDRNIVVEEASTLR